MNGLETLKMSDFTLDAGSLETVLKLTLEECLEEDGIIPTLYEKEEILNDLESLREIKYRFRFFSNTIAVDSFVGNVTTGQFYDVCRSMVGHLKKNLLAVEDNAEWGLFAFSCQKTTRIKRGRRPNPQGGRLPDPFAEDPKKPGHGFDNPQNTEFKPLEERVWVIQFGFVDKLKGEEVDTWYQRTGQESPISAFIRSKDPKKLPKSHKFWRSECLRIFRESQAKDISPELKALVSEFTSKGVAYSVALDIAKGLIPKSGKIPEQKEEHFDPTV